MLSKGVNPLMKWLCIMLILALFLPCAASAEEDYDPSVEGIATGIVNARVACHDPSILAADGKYYIFGTHMVAAFSTDLRGWSGLANGYSPKNRVWGDLFAEGSHVFDYAGLGTSLIPTDDGACHVWAPGVIYNPVMKKYMMYYCTTSTWCISNLCFALSDVPEGPYVWQAPLIYSGFDKKTIEATDVRQFADESWIKKHHLTLAGGYNYRECPNAIDPAVFFDADQRLWMVYGSYSGGIFLLELDPSTGLVIHPEADEAQQVDPYFGRRLLGGNHQSIEGPWILYDAEAGWYYLFVSYGGLNRTGGYQIRVFRSRTPEGEYLDMNGARPAKAGHALYGLKLSGNYTLPSVRTAYMATGHNSAMVDTDGKRYICYHTRFDNGTEGHLPLVKQFAVSEDGWPCMLPYATRKETIPGSFSLSDVPGRYFVINQGTSINADIAAPFILYLREDGSVGGESVSGSWSLENQSVFLRLSLGDQSWSGIICPMQDDAGTDVTVFSLVGRNESVWGVKYHEE